MFAASAAGRSGAAYDAKVVYEGDPGVLAVTAPALEAARAVATLDVEFPEGI